MINEVNGTAIVDQIIHSHDQKQFHRGSKKPDICITEEDLEDLDLDSLDVKPMPRKCIDTCSPIAARIGLAVAWACATGFAAICLLLTSLAAFFSFCCCNPTEPPTYFMVRFMLRDVASHAEPVLTLSQTVPSVVHHLVMAELMLRAFGRYNSVQIFPDVLHIVVQKTGRNSETWCMP